MPKHHDHTPGHTPHAAKHHGQKAGAEDSAIQDGLQAIYGDDRSDLHVVERDGSGLSRLLTRIVLGLALFAVLAFGGFFLYTTFFDQNTSKQALVLSIEAPPEVKSGEQTQIIINYSNPSGIPLAALELDINLPASFALSMAQPEPTTPEELIWIIGSLGSHSDGQIILDGVWLSGVPSTTTVQALAAYRPGNFNSNFSDIATATVTTLSSVLTLELTGPEIGTPGQPLTYTAKIKNTGLEVMNNAQFALTLPTGFVLTSSTPSLEAGADPEWELGNLMSEAEALVTWAGSFTADVKDVQQFAAVVSVPESDRQLPQASAQWFTDVAGSDFQTTMVINGNTDKATTEPGGTLRLTVRLENAGDTDLSGGSFLIDFKPDSGIPIIWSSASLAGGKLTPAGIVFDSAVVGTVKAGEKKTYNLSFPIKDTLAATEVDEWTATTYVTLGETQVQTPPFPISMKASADVSARASFYSDTGAPIGEGPLPPEVGEATTYRIFWQIAKAVHELQDVTVSATLPPDVSWDNRVLSSTGNVQFDATTGTVRWETSSLPANEEATAEFTVKLIPGEEDVGTFVKLLSGTALSATDADTGAAVEAESESFTTEIPEDTFAVGKGTVVD